MSNILSTAEWFLVQVLQILQIEMFQRCRLRERGNRPLLGKTLPPRRLNSRLKMKMREHGGRLRGRQRQAAAGHR